MVKTSSANHFSLIADERQQGKVRHPLISIFFIAVAAAVADSDDWEDVVFWAGEKECWLKRFIDLPYGIPSISTFERVFRLVDPKQFEKCFVAWARDIAEDADGRTVAIDGKALRGARSAVHIVSAWMSGEGLSIGEVKVSDKSNEITAIPELLKLLSIEGSVVTIDAAGTQTAIARQIVKENHADYVLALKGNQPSMHKDAALLFSGVDIEKEQDAKEAERKIQEAAAQMPALIAEANGGGALPDGSPAFLGMDFQSAQTSEKGHGRIERRVYALVDDIGWLSRRREWEGLAALGMAARLSTEAKTGAQSYDMRFFLSSVSDIEQFSNSVRAHWGIESMHWTLDVTFSEDKSRIRKDNEPQNMAVIRKLAMNFLKAQKKSELGSESVTNKVRRESYKVKRKRAMMREDYLEKIMVGNFQ